MAYSRRNRHLSLEYDPNSELVKGLDLMIALGRELEDLRNSHKVKGRSRQ